MEVDTWFDKWIIPSVIVLIVLTIIGILPILAVIR